MSPCVKLSTSCMNCGLDFRRGRESLYTVVSWPHELQCVYSSLAHSSLSESSDTVTFFFSVQHYLATGLSNVENKNINQLNTDTRQITKSSLCVPSCILFGKPSREEFFALFLICTSKVTLKERKISFPF